MTLENANGPVEGAAAGAATSNSIPADLLAQLAELDLPEFNDVDISTTEIRRALEIACDLVAAGVPVFFARPDNNHTTGYALPRNWETTLQHNYVGIRNWVNAWKRREYGALCAVAGHVVDVLDIDPRNGGTQPADELKAAGLWPTSYGTASTPSGGTHDLIATLGVKKCKPADGIDLQAGAPDGSGRGFVFIAPTIRISKATGRHAAYKWVVEPFLDELDGSDDSGLGIVEMVAARRAKEPKEHVATGPAASSGEVLQRVQQLCDELSGAPEGEGNDTAARIAFMVGQYVGARQVSRADAISALENAVAGWVYRDSGDFDGMCNTIAYQVDKGSESPRTWAESYASVDIDDWFTEPKEQPKVVKSLNLPEDFWSARPVLGHIRQAAYSWGKPADVAFHGVLARLSSMLPPQVQFQSGLNPNGSLNCFVAVVGPAGIGKSSSQFVAKGLLGIPAHLNEDLFRDDLPIGTGQGLIEAFHGYVEEEYSDPKTGKTRKKQVKKQVRENVLLAIDEGEALFREAANKTSITLPTLRSAWSGQTLGQTNASAETTRRLPGGSYSLGLVVGFQMSTAQPLLDDVAGGTPQRFLWCSVTDPNVPHRPTVHPGPLDVALTKPWGHGKAYAVDHTEISFAQEIKDELWTENLLRVQGQVTVDNPLDAHRPMTLCKVASLLALLDSRRNVTVEDWELAKVVWETSCAVRDSVVAYGQEARRLVEDTAVQKHVKRELLTRQATDRYVAVQEDKDIVRVARWLAKRVSEKGLLTRKDVREAMASRDKKHLDDALVYATGQDWVLIEDGKYGPGGSKPQ